MKEEVTQQDESLCWCVNYNAGSFTTIIYRMSHMPTGLCVIPALRLSLTVILVSCHAKQSLELGTNLA